MGKKRTKTAWVQSSLGRARWGYWSPELISAFSRPGSSPPPRSSLVPAVEKSASELFACERAWMELLVLGRIPVVPLLTWAQLASAPVKLLSGPLPVTSWVCRAPGFKVLS